MDNIAELYDLHCFESATDHLEFIDSLLMDNNFIFPVAEHEQCGVRSPNPTQTKSNAADKWLPSTSLPGGSNPAVDLHRILSSGK